MATEAVALLGARHLIRETSSGGDSEINLAGSGDLRGVSLHKLGTCGYTAWFVIPANLTMGTGLTFKLPIVDDGTNADDLGKVVRLGVTPKLIASGSDNLDIDSGAATESTVDVTLDATSGEVVIGSLAIAAASLDSAAVGGMLAIRIRRIGTHANDTCKSRVILLGCYVLNT